MARTILDKRPSKLFILLNGAAAGKSADELANILNKSPGTTRKRMRQPEDLTLAELKRLGRGLHISIDDLRQAITY